MDMLLAVMLATALSITTPIPLDQARHVFDEARLASEDDGGKLWGQPLDGPLIFADPRTRFVVANAPDANGSLKATQGVYTGQLPETVIIANHAVDWSGVHWTMVMWPVGDNAASRRRLVMHECFHRIQESIGFPANDPKNGHLDSIEGRYWFLLELRALSAALRSDGDARNRAILDAELFRMSRRLPFPIAQAQEIALESNEGLAEYTGWALRGTSAEESRMAVAHTLDGVSRDRSFVRSFAYLTGPAYGLLLDNVAPDWRKSFHATDDLAQTLMKASKLVAPEDAVAAAKDRANVYAGPQLRAEEETRDHLHRELLARFRARLVDGPVLELPMTNARYGFDPNDVIPIEGHGNAFSSLTVSADWGTVAADQGALIASDYSKISVPATTPVKLKPGWKKVAGARAGDLRVVHE